MKNYVSFRNKGVCAFLFFVYFFLVSCSKKEEVIDESEASSPPLDLVISGRASTSVSLSWKRPFDEGKVKSGIASAINFYEVWASKSEDFSNRIVKTTPGTTFNMVGLEGGGTKYYFKVRASNSAKIFSEHSDTASSIIGSASKATSPDKPTELVILSGTLTGSGVVVRWDASENFGKERDGTPASISSYRIDYSEAEDFSSKKSLLIDQEQPLEAFITGLNPMTQYYLRVLSRNNSGDVSKEWSEPSDPINFTTTPLMATSPLPPTTILIKEGSLQSEQVIITWQTPKSSGTKDGVLAARIIKYEVEYSLISDFSFGVKKIDTPETEATLMDLLPVKTYYVRVRAVNNNSQESQNTSLYVEGGFETPRPENAGDADPPGAVISMMIPESDIQELQAKITWQAPVYFGRKKDGVTASLLNFVLEYSESPIFDEKIIQSVSPKELELIIRNLKVSTTYYVRVRSKNNNRIFGLDESENNISEFQTLIPTPPDPPLNVEVAHPPGEDLGKTQVEVTWNYTSANRVGKKGDNTDAKLIGFEVEYSSDNFVNDIQKVSQNLESQNRRAIVSQLSNNKTYKFRVRALNDNNFKDSEVKAEAASEYTISQAITTKSNEAKPDAPSSVQVSPPDSIDEARGALIVSWQVPSSPGRNPDGTDSEILKYIVEYVVITDDTSITFPSNDTDSSIKKVETSNSTTRSIKILGLIPNTSYAFRVRTVNTNTSAFSDASISLPSQLVSSNTRDLSAPPAQAQPLKSNDLPSGGRAYDSVKITWDEVTDLGKNPQGETTGLSIQGYEVRWYSKFKPSTLTLREVTSTSPPFTSQMTPSFERTSLDESTVYIFEIVTVSNNSTPYSMKSAIKQLEVTIAPKPRYAVIFDLNQGIGNNTTNTQNVSEGDFASIPATPPTREGYYFDKWVTQLNDEFDFTSSKITQDITLYAKYINIETSIKAKVADANLTGIGSTTVQGTVLPSVQNNKRITRTVKEVINTYLTDDNDLNDAEIDYLLRNLKTAENTDGKFSFELGLGDPTDGQESRFTIITNWGDEAKQGEDITLMPLDYPNGQSYYLHSPKLTFKPNIGTISIFADINDGLATSIRSFKVITNY